ncbi:MAG: DUF3307 domain-containing protein [Candidatus Omnitrophica bacterium]|nr:DUF3307 domain-containing protein [Candidatus Omnitrophota bacterium]
MLIVEYFPNINKIMFIFLRLVLAHLIGDFPLQFNKVYNLKQKGLIGIIPHATIIMLCYIILSLPYLNLPGLWGFIFFLTITHLFQDSIKLSYKGMKFSFLFYILDQIFHLSFISMILLTNLRQIAPLDNPKDNLIISFYNNNLTITYLIFLILATYNGYFMIRNIKTTIIKKFTPSTTFEKWYGILERAGLVSIFLLEKYLFIYISFILILRPIVFIISRKKLSITEEFISGLETILSWSIGIVSGLCLCIVKHTFI